MTGVLNLNPVTAGSLCWERRKTGVISEQPDQISIIQAGLLFTSDRFKYEPTHFQKLSFSCCTVPSP